MAFLDLFKKKKNPYENAQLNAALQSKPQVSAPAQPQYELQTPKEQTPSAQLSPLAGATEVKNVSVTATPANQWSSKNASLVGSKPAVQQTKTTPVNPFAKFPQQSVDTTGLENIANQQKERYGTQWQQTQDYLNKTNELANKALGDQVPVIQNAYNEFESNTNASIGDQQAATERGKQNAEENFGTAQKQAAMTRSESDARIMGKYAANNALSGAGFGSYTAASSQLENQFNQFTQENIQSKKNQFEDLDRTQIQFEREARSLINQEKAKLQYQIQQIQTQIGLNTAEGQYALQKVQGEYQNQVDQVSTYLEQLNMQKQQLAQSMQQDNYILSNLSPQFKANGQPTSEIDYYWIQNNPEPYKAILSGMQQNNQSGNLTEKQQAYQSASNLANTALGLLESGNVDTGIGDKFWGNIGEKTGLNTQSQTQYRSTIALLRTAVRNAMLGSAMSEQEMESVNAAIPEFNDAPNTARNKIDTLQKLLPLLSGRTQSVNLASNQGNGLQSFIEQ